MDSYYAKALRDYAAVTCEALHSYLIEGLRYWYEKFPPSEVGGWADVDEADAPGEGTVMRVDPAPPPASFNMVFKAAASAAPPAPASAAPAPPADADAGAAREAAAAE